MPRPRPSRSWPRRPRVRRSVSRRACASTPRRSATTTATAASCNTFCASWRARPRSVMTAMDRRELLIHGAALAGTFASLRAFAAAREPVLGGPCEGCDWVYDGMPTTLAANARIAPADQAGEPMVIEGLVTTSRGRPAGNVIVYAYHTDQT